MATKKQIVKELVKIGVDESEASLMKKSIPSLEAMLEEKKAPVAQPAIDLEALKAEMMAQLKAEMEAKVREELLAEIKFEAKAPEAPKKVTEIDRNRQIPVMNITAFSLVYSSPRTGAEWNWSSYGDIEYMEMQELLTMRSSQRRFLDEPFILIMDEDAVSYLGLEKAYDNLIDPSNIDKVFKMNMNDFKEVIEKAPKGIQILIVNRAKQLIDSGELDSGHKIRFINEKFGTDLTV